jgi:hypothetical protein
MFHQNKLIRIVAKFSKNDCPAANQYFGVFLDQSGLSGSPAIGEKIFNLLIEETVVQWSPFPTYSALDFFAPDSPGPAMDFSTGSAISPSKTRTTSPDGNLVATITKEGNISVSQHILRTITLLSPSGKNLEWSKDSRRLSLLDEQGITHVWDVVSGQLLEETQLAPAGPMKQKDSGPPGKSDTPSANPAQRAQQPSLPKIPGGQDLQSPSIFPSKSPATTVPKAPSSAPSQATTSSTAIAPRVGSVTNRNRNTLPMQRPTTLRGTSYSTSESRLRAW